MSRKVGQVFSHINTLWRQYFLIDLTFWIVVMAIWVWVIDHQLYWSNIAKFFAAIAFVSPDWPILKKTRKYSFLMFDVILVQYINWESASHTYAIQTERFSLDRNQIVNYNERNFAFCDFRWRNWLYKAWHEDTGSHFQVSLCYGDSRVWNFQNMVFHYFWWQNYYFK